MESFTRRDKLGLKVSFKKEEILSVEVKSESVEVRKIEAALPEERDMLALRTCPVASGWFRVVKGIMKKID